MVCPGHFSRYFNSCSRRFGLLLVLLSQWGEWEEVALVAEAPVDVPLLPLLGQPRLVAVPHRAHECVLPFIRRVTVTWLSFSGSSPQVSPGVGLRSHFLIYSCWMRRVALALSREG
jgi:hypothetical protein